ncbi:DUF4430 domain-containing protein [Patescibacteria group bacterium]|nr:DUF4430 domain-containing protein [Patescibacteria group bacterium]
MTEKNPKKILQILIPLIFVFVIIVLWQKQGPQYFAEPKETPNTRIIVVKFEFDNEDVVQLQYPHRNPSESLLDIASNISAEQNWDFSFEDYGEMGYLVTKIRDHENGIDQKYWQYFVDFEQPLISADKFFPQPGQLIEWKFEKSRL